MTRNERVERLLHELRYEIEVGMLQGEIDETIGFEFYVPTSKSIPDGVVYCSFRTRPVHRKDVLDRGYQKPRLKAVK